MKTRRILSAALAAALSLSVLLSCAADPADTPESTPDTAGSPETTLPAETAADPNDRSQVKDNVPDGLTFDGETVRVLYRGEGLGQERLERLDVVGTDNVGDYVTDGTWNRNRTVEERLAITMELVPTNAGDLSATIAMIKNLVIAATDEYDYIVSTCNTTVVSSLNGYMRDLAALPYVDYSAPWWWEETTRALSVDGKVYNYIFGDALLHCYTKTGVVYYNKALYEAAFGDPDAMYREVLDGTWTIDRMSELTATGYKDANGDGIENAGDIFGAMKSQNQGEETPHFMQGFDIEMYHYDENDSLIIEFDQEASIDAIEKLSRFYLQTVGVFHSDLTIDSSDKYFAEGNILFFPGRLSAATDPMLREMKSDYGILPYPKRTVEQENYVSLIHNSSTNFCVLKAVPESRMELIGATLEAINAESYRSVMPLFLETAMKLKYSRDQLSGQVIDIVVESVRKNPLMEYTAWTANIFDSCLANPSRSGSNNFASAYKKVAVAAQKMWDKAVASLEG